MKCTHVLRSFDINPPGNYFYLQTQGLRREFGPSPDIIALGNEVYQFRKGNDLQRATLKESIDDISCYVCFCLGGMSSYCVPINNPNTALALNASSPVVAPPCSGCGVRL